MKQFGSSGSLKSLAEHLLAPPAPSAPPMAQYGQAPVQQMQHGRLIDPMAVNGDGMADKTPAMIDGQQPAAMGSGEYVLPADVVSGLGNGSTAAGAQELDALAGRVRKMRTGGIAQAPQINPQAALPA